jgi:hypothetical protein
MSQHIEISKLVALEDKDFDYPSLSLKLPDEVPKNLILHFVTRLVTNQTSYDETLTTESIYN